MVAPRRERERDPAARRGERRRPARAAAPRVPAVLVDLARAAGHAVRRRLPRRRPGPARLRGQRQAAPGLRPGHRGLEDAAGLVRALGEANAVVVGHDWGGLVAWTMAAYYPKVVRRLAVISMAHPLRMRYSVVTHPLGQGRRSGYASAPGSGGSRAQPGPGSRPAGRADAALLVRAGLAGPGNRAALPDRDVHPLGGAFRAGVPPLVRPLPGPPGRPALCPADARAYPGPHPAYAGRARYVRAARHVARSGRRVDSPCRWRLLDGAPPLPARGAAGPFDRELRGWLAEPEPER